MTTDSDQSQFKPEPARDYFGTSASPTSPIKPSTSTSSISKRVSRSNSSGLLAKIASRVSSHQPKDSVSSSLDEDLALNATPSSLKGSLSKSSRKTKASTIQDDPNASPTSPKADIAALTRSNSKFKSATVSIINHLGYSVTGRKRRDGRSA